MTTGDEGWDRFSFTIKLDDYKRKLEERQLILCVRFSVDGREWWDSNNGINYNFTFKKAPPRRPVRNSTPPTLGGNFTAGLQGARHRGASPLSFGTDMNKAFGVPPKSQHSQGPVDWIFPKLATMVNETPRSESPALSPPPAASFRAPAPPDVHTHLSLSKKYCAPTPTTSPNTILRTEFIEHTVDSPTPLTSMQMVAGHPATLSPPQASTDHNRAASWSGVRNGSWESFPSSMDRLDAHGAPGAPDSAPSSRDGSVDSFVQYRDTSTPKPPSDGESTPVAGSRSPINLPESDGSSGSSPVSRPLSFKRSTGDLQALRLAAGEESTEEDPMPSSSNLSSPPYPRLGLPNIMDLGSPSASASTGESSPVNTVSADGSVVDLTAMDIQVDPLERGRSLALDERYQELVSSSVCFGHTTPIDMSVVNPWTAEAREPS